MMKELHVTAGLVAVQCSISDSWPAKLELFQREKVLEPLCPSCCIFCQLHLPKLLHLYHLFYTYPNRHHGPSPKSNRAQGPLQP